MIYVTHDQIEAMTMGDKICVMKDGIVQQIAGPLELYDKPLNKFVAGFIGTPPMNFFNVDIVKENDNLVLKEGSFDIHVPDFMKDKLVNFVGQKIVMGVRPEDIYDKLFLNISHQVTASFNATVDIVEPLGSEIYLHFNTGKNIMVAKVDSNNKTTPNQSIELVFDLKKIHLFELESGKTII